ncbi:MAG: hypothetical protein JWL73_2522 [Actinomycetia bacterium]|nr:hypothetical protein [Actinomycetes bacterium]
MRAGHAVSVVGVALRLEFTVEPFVEGEPGPHVLAAVEAARAFGLEVDFGPFGSAIDGDDEPLLDALDAIARAAMAAGATRVSLQLSRR